MTRDRAALYAYLSLIFVMLFWAGNAIVGRAMRTDVPPFTLAFLRWLIAFAVVLPLSWRQLRAERAALLQGWKPILLLGVLGVGSFNGLMYLGLHFTNATNAMLFQAAVPGLVLLADRLLFAQSAPGTRVAGVLLSAIGVIIVVIRADISVLAGLHLGIGDLLVLTAVALWALYTCLLRIRPPVHSLSFLASTFLIGIFCMAPFAGWEWAVGKRPHFGPGTIAAILYVGIFPSVLSYLMFNRAVETIGSARTGQTTSLLPLFGALIAAAVLGEKLHGYHLVGMILILGGIGFGLAADWRGKAGERPDN